MKFFKFSWWFIVFIDFLEFKNILFQLFKKIKIQNNLLFYINKKHVLFCELSYFNIYLIWEFVNVINFIIHSYFLNILTKMWYKFFILCKRWLEKKPNRPFFHHKIQKTPHMNISSFCSSSFFPHLSHFLTFQQPIILIMIIHSPSNLEVLFYNNIYNNNYCYNW